MNIIIFGPPLAGKGTQSKKIISDFNLIHLSTGDVLRAEKEKGTELGLEAAKYSNEGNLVPDTLVTKIVESFYQTINKNESILFDGYPRNSAQAEHLVELLKNHAASIDFVIYLKVPKEILLKRAEKRAIEENRIDDADKNKVLNRIEEFVNFTIPAINYVSSLGIKTIEIDGTQTVEQIYDIIYQNLNN